MNPFLIAILLLTPPVLAIDCDLSLDGIRKYEHRILNSDSPQVRNESLACLFAIQNQADPDTRYLANAYLRVLLGGPLVKDVPPNPKYPDITRRFEEQALKGDSLVQEFAAGDWQFYKLFCEEGDLSHCATMIPDEDRIQKQTPLIAAGSLLHLRQAYLLVTGEQKKQIAERIKNLYAKIPKQAKIQRRYIEKIYAELFGPEIPLSLWS